MPQQPTMPTGSCAIVMPISAAQTGSVPSRRLTLDGEVRLTAQVCIKKAKTVHPTTRYRKSAPRPGSSPETNRGIESSENSETPVKSAAHVASWTVVRCSESIGRWALILCMEVTCTARMIAATRTRRSPSVGGAQRAVAGQQHDPDDRDRGGDEESAGQRSRRHDCIENRSEHDRQADDESGVGGRGVRDTERLERKHPCQQYPEDNARAHFCPGHTPSTSSDEPCHDPRCQQHAHSHQRDH